MRTTIGLLFVVGVLGACGSSSGGGGDGGGGTGGDAMGGGGTGGMQDAHGACAALAEVLCARVESCGPSMVERYYGDMAACASIHTRQCEAVASLPGVDASSIAARADELQSAPCWSIFDEHDLSPYAGPQGTLPDGSSCEMGYQCATGWCHHDETLCGTCEPQPEPSQVNGTTCKSAGDPPSVFWCDSPDFVCDVDTTTCVPTPTVGDACVNNWCGGYGIVCKEGQCVVPLYAGEACDPQADACHAGANLVCDPATGTCKSAPPTSGACGGFESLSCDYDEYCVSDGSDAPGSCVPLLLEGESCDENAFLQCVWSLLCVDGKCSVHTATDICGG